MGLPWWLRWQSVCLQRRRPRFDPWVGKIPWKRKWQPTPVLLPGKSYGQRSLVGYSPWGPKESDMTEGLSMHIRTLLIETKLRTERLHDQLKIHLLSTYKEKIRI